MLEFETSRLETYEHPIDEMNRTDRITPASPRLIEDVDLEYAIRSAERISLGV